MSELKTLKDLPTNHDDEDIKAEAVKWVKHFRYEGTEPVSLIEFFNLTKEDLR